eukprot:jgi/Tetstr1/433910/TSEL_023090.t1
MCSQPLKLDPDRFQLPPEGIFTFDYITYQHGTVLEGKKKNALQRKLFPQLSPLQFDTMLKSLEVLRTVEMEAIERSKARQAREARLAERAAVGAKTQWKKAGGRVSVARLKLDLSTKRVVEDGTVTRADDAEDTEGEEDLGTGLDSARARPTSVMELFRELEAQEEAASLAARLAERALSRKGSLKPAAGKDGPAAAKDGGGDEEAGPVRVEWAGKRRWEGTISKVKDIRGISAGLADVLQDDLPNCTPLELLRSFAGSKYVTCKQVLMILKLFNFHSTTNGSASQQRVAIVQVLFTRLVDTVHFADVLRNLDREAQAAVNRRLGYHNTILTGIREDNSHLHRLHFSLRLSVEDEYLCGKRLAEYVVRLPNKPGLEGGPYPIFRNLHINGAPVSVAEDKQFWKTLCMLGKERKKPDASWDPAGTLEFQLMYPDRWIRSAFSVKIQNGFRTHRRRMKILKQLRDGVDDATTAAAPSKPPRRSKA